MLLSSGQSITQNLDALPVVVPETSTHELRSNLAFSSKLEHFAQHL